MTNDEIETELRRLEKLNNIKIVYACESGSRGWGFASPDSDYDIRFIYAHPMDWYLSVFPGKDTIDIPISGDSDMGGWELRKSFALLKKSNCALIEWLSSPIVYRQDLAAIQYLSGLVDAAFLSISACHHYLSMAKGKLTDILNSNEVKLKSYFYALRASLCALYITDHQSPPPMQIAPLIEEYVPAQLFVPYRELWKQKTAHHETYRSARLPWLDGFLHDTVERVEQNLPRNQNNLETGLLDAAFRDALRAVWER